MNKFIESWAEIFELKIKNHDTSLKLAIERHARMSANEKLSDTCGHFTDARMDALVQKTKEQCWEVISEAERKGELKDRFQRCLDAMSA